MPASYPAWGLDVLPYYLEKEEFMPFPLGNTQTPSWGYSAIALPKSVVQLQTAKPVTPGLETEIRIQTEGWIPSPLPELPMSPAVPCLPCPFLPILLPLSASCHPPTVLGPAMQGRLTFRPPCAAFSGLKMAQMCFTMHLQPVWAGTKDLCRPMSELGSHC